MDTFTKDQWDVFLKQFSYREREIMKLRFGLGDGFVYTLEEIGHFFKCTRDRIAKVIEKAERKASA